MNRRIVFAVGAAALLVILGCSARKAEPNRGPLVLNDREKTGQRVFMRYCHQCHPNGEGGVGPSLNEKPLPPAFIKAQVRNGNGAMPPFGEQRISDERLMDIVDYMTKLRSH